MSCKNRNSCSVSNVKTTSFKIWRERGFVFFLFVCVCVLKWVASIKNSWYLQTRTTGVKTRREIVRVCFGNFFFPSFIHWTGTIRHGYCFIHMLSLPRMQLFKLPSLIRRRNNIPRQIIQRQSSVCVNCLCGILISCLCTNSAICHLIRSTWEQFGLLIVSVCWVSHPRHRRKVFFPPTKQKLVLEIIVKRENEIIHCSSVHQEIEGRWCFGQICKNFSTLQWFSVLCLYSQGFTRQYIILVR